VELRLLDAFNHLVKLCNASATFSQSLFTAKAAGDSSSYSMMVFPWTMDLVKAGSNGIGSRTRRPFSSAIEPTTGVAQMRPYGHCPRCSRGRPATMGEESLRGLSRGANLQESRHLFFQNLDLFEDYLEILCFIIILSRFLMEPPGKTSYDYEGIPELMGHPF
jgi:hypothetical protein